MPEILRCTKDDFDATVRDIADFWGSDRTLHLHHPMFVHEFGDTAFVVREDGRGCRERKAITTPGNRESIAFHTALGFEVRVVPDYAGPGQDRVVFRKVL